MAAPTTGFEDSSGDYTTLADEQAFLETIASETAATLSVAGESVEGRPIWRLDLGTDRQSTWLCVATQHAREPVAREATLSFLRDLAYSTDPEILDYLSTHRIVFVPNANPDGTPGRTRRNANGVDINRDGFALTQPEALTLQHLIRDTGALLVTDGHEQVGTPSEEMQYLRPELDSIYQGIAARGDDLVATLQAAFTSSSISHGPYPN